MPTGFIQEGERELNDSNYLQFDRHHFVCFVKQIAVASFANPTV